MPTAADAVAPAPEPPSSCASIALRSRRTEPPCAIAGRDAPGDGRPGEAGEQRRILSEPVRDLADPARARREVARLELDAASAREPDDPAADRGDELRHLTGRGRWQGSETRPAARCWDEDAVGDQAVEVDVQVEGGTRPLDRRDGTAHPAAETAPPGAAALQAEDRTDEDREYGAAQAVVPGHGVPEPPGAGEHPLADGQTAEHRIDEVHRALCHAPAAARRAEATPLAGEGNEDLRPAAIAPEADEAARKAAAREEVAQLALHEGRNSGAVRASSRCVEELEQVRLDDLEERARGGRARHVSARAAVP